MWVATTAATWRDLGVGTSTQGTGSHSTTGTSKAPPSQKLISLFIQNSSSSPNYKEKFDCGCGETETVSIMSCCSCPKLDSHEGSFPPEFYLDYCAYVPGRTWFPKSPRVLEPPMEQKGGHEEDRDENEKDGEGYEEKKEGSEEKKEGAEVDDFIPSPESERKERFQEKSEGVDSHITVDQASHLARDLGFAPSEQDVDNLRISSGGTVTYDAFQDFLVDINHPEDTLANLVKFFAMFDENGTGELSKAVIINLLTNFGEPLQDELAADILR
eukprot:GHVN01001396.1.p2 GENE.GHVN01001396.1~~GHVN01001396.1.p2  ORF type:complete len:272 (-),score=31.71 GHVN01001396.1:176-991(-)